jgi:hypothetical protein
LLDLQHTNKNELLDNGFCINEVEYNNLLDCPVDEAAAKNPELLNFIIGHFVPTKANSKGIRNLILI